jgi:hypothetical protein
LTGVSQAGRLPCCGSGAPPWDPSAEVLASVSLTAGLSLNLFLFVRTRAQPVRRPQTPGVARPAGGGGQSPGPKRIVPARAGITAECCVTCRSRPVEKTLTPGHLACATAPGGPLRGEPRGLPGWPEALPVMAPGDSPGLRWIVPIWRRDLVTRHADPAVFRPAGTPCAGTVPCAAASRSCSAPGGAAWGTWAWPGSVDQAGAAPSLRRAGRTAGRERCQI